MISALQNNTYSYICTYLWGKTHENGIIVENFAILNNLIPPPKKKNCDSEDTLNLDLLEYRFGQYLVYQLPMGIVNTLLNISLSRMVSVITPT